MFVALGDSYTIGEGVAADDTFPARVARALAMPAPVIVAQTGWTTDELDRALDGAHLQGPFDLVTLLIGVNDHYRGRAAPAYRPAFASLLGRAIAFGAGDPRRVIVLSIPDWSVTPFAAGRDRAKIAAGIDAFNAVNREEAALAGAPYADITPLSRAAADDTSLLAADGLHPSGRMYERWLDVILPIAREIVNR